MINKSGYDEKEFHYLYTRLLHQKINAFFCVTCNSILMQREIAAEIQGLFPAGGESENFATWLSEQLN